MQTSRSVLIYKSQNITLEETLETEHNSAASLMRKQREGSTELAYSCVFLVRYSSIRYCPSLVFHSSVKRKNYETLFYYSTSLHMVSKLL